MQNQELVKKLIIICFCILFILLILMCVIISREQKKVNIAEPIAVVKQDVTNDVYDDSKTYINIKDVLESYNCEFIKQESTPIKIIYLNFAKDLFNTDGTNNRKFYESLINACAKRLVEDKFYLYDENKSIKIEVICDLKNSTITYKINNQNNYFDIANPEIYSEIEKSQIAEYQPINQVYNVLYKLTENNMYITDDLGEEEGVDGKYKIYQNGTIKSRNFKGKVRNIIFLPEYANEVLTGIKVGTPLKQVEELYPNIAFGGLNEGFLGYRTKDLYVFIYEDEISAYGYSYYKQTNFEKILEEYILYKDLDFFVNKLTEKWTNYDNFEYDKERQNLYLTYPSNGVIIDIKNNDSKGITLYNNYYLSDKTKKFIVEGKITLNSQMDSLYMSEMNRRNNTQI